MEADKAPDRLLDITAGETSSLTLAYPEQPTIELRRNASGWRMTAPVEATADAEAVERLLTTIVGLKLERRIGPDERQALAVYGLGEQGEQANVTLGLADGSELPTIIVGRTTPVGFSAYVRLTGSEEVAVTPLIFHTGVKKDPFDLREKRLLVFEAANVIALELDSRETGRIALERRGNRWRITEPVKDEADTGQIEALLRALAGLKASSFLDDEKPRAALGPGKPRFSIAVEVGGQGRARLAFGKTVPERTPPASYAVRSPDGQVAEVESAMLVRLDKDLATLRDKHLFDCEADEVVRMSFERSDGQGFSVTRSGDGNWNLAPETAGKLRQALIERARNGLADMAGAEIVSETDPELYGLSPPEVEVELYAGDGGSCGRAVAGKVDEADRTRYFVKRGDGQMVMSVPEYLYSRMNRLAGDFLETE